MRILVCVVALMAIMDMAQAQTVAWQCQRLRELHREYRGVVLSEDQKAVKVAMVAFYNANCRRRAQAHGRQASPNK